jgi:hypothetical protein
MAGCGGSDSSGNSADGDGGADGSVGADGGGDVGSFGHDGGGADAGNCNPAAPDQTGCRCTTVGQARACYLGPPGTRGVGACHDGTQTCLQNNEFGEYGPCTGVTPPGPEGCTSTVDSNCNGLIGCADPKACPGGCPVDAGPDVVVPDSGTTCVPPIVSNSGERCPNGYVLGPNGDCCPCAATDCATNNACCAAPACAGDPSCATCAGSTLPAICNGNVDVDCDDFTEDCDQLCCPCKPSTCQACPTNQVPCDDGTGTLVCTDVTGNDLQCGACDTTCSAPQHCVNGWCQ